MAYSIEKVISHPLTVINDTFNNAVRQNGGNVPTGDWDVPAQFVSVLNDTTIKNVPILSEAGVKAGKFAPDTLVRYRGMVQDTFSPEYFQAVHTLKPTQSTGEVQIIPTKYRDTFNPVDGYEAQGSQMQSRTSLYLVPIPAESKWARDMTLGQWTQLPQQQDQSTCEVSTQRKRRMEDGPSESLESGDQQMQDVSKRPNHAATETSQHATATATSSASGVTTTDASMNPSASNEQEQIRQYFPDPSECDIPCLARIYGEESNCPLRVGDAVEIIGIYSVDPGLNAFNMIGSAYPQAGDTEEDVDMRFAMANDEETFAKNPSSSVVPRLHCILWRKLSPVFPIIQPPLESSRGTFQLTYESVESSAQPTEASQAERDREMRRRQLTRELDERSTLEEVAEHALSELSNTFQNDAQGNMSTSEAINQMRQAVIELLSNTLGGDVLAAEYILFGILARVTARPDGQSLGKLIVNVSGVPEYTKPCPGTEQSNTSETDNNDQAMNPSENRMGNASSAQTQQQQQQQQPSNVIPIETFLPLQRGASPVARRLWLAISSIVPRCAILPIRLEYMNNIPLAPIKSYDTNRLKSGLLQLTTGTTLIVDESVMHTGQLGDRGVRNLQALAKVTTSAELPYDFQYHVADFPVDIPSIILSTGKPLVPCDIRIPLSSSARSNLSSWTNQMDTEIETNENNLSVDEMLMRSIMAHPNFIELLTVLRKFIAAVRYLRHEISSDVSNVIEEDMVGERQRSSITQEQMHLWMTLARIDAMSFGETNLTIERWRHVRQLEAQRSERLPTVTPPVPRSPETPLPTPPQN